MLVFLTINKSNNLEKQAPNTLKYLCVTLNRCRRRRSIRRLRRYLHFPRFRSRTGRRLLAANPRERSAVDRSTDPLVRTLALRRNGYGHKRISGHRRRFIRIRSDRDSPISSRYQRHVDACQQSAEDQPVPVVGRTSMPRPVDQQYVLLRGRGVFPVLGQASRTVRMS